ncbi:MAG: beta-ketoacyl synthase N-terminal-like domain-containing protein [Proteobacteria bacterium]|nr:beta-ketoacyl synthase N-terminal-like domain-containing protein [Pseudomonadota bacterium]
MSRRPDYSSLEHLSALHDQAGARHEYVQLVHNGQPHTNKQVHARAASMACYLGEHGVGRGSNVAVCTRLCPEAFSVFPAVWRLGATVVPIIHKLSGPQIAEILQLTGVEVLVVSADIYDRISADLAAISHLRQIVTIDGERSGCVAFGSIAALAATATVSSARGSDPALILFSSGSTGKPKGIIQTHGNLLHEIEIIHRERERAAHPRYLLGQTQPCRVLFNTPLGHTVGTAGLTLNIASGGTFILQDVIEVEEMLRLIQDHAIEAYFYGPPTVYAALLEYPSLDAYDLSSMRYWATGAAPISYERVAQIKAILPGDLGIMYGLTESSCISTAVLCDEHFIPDSVGKALPGLEICIRGANGSDVPPGSVGEVCIRGETISPGYLDLDEETQKTFRAGWLHTGDLGALDQAGNLTLAGRSKLVIIQAGINILPRTVEVVLEAIPEVKECAVLGVPDEILGERVVAFVAFKQGRSQTSSALRDLCRRRLATYEVPRQFIVLPNLPRTGSNKIDLGALRSFARQPPSAPTSNDRLALVEMLRDIARQLDLGDLPFDRPLMQAGVDSLAAVELALLLGERLGRPISETLIFNHPTLNDVIAYLQPDAAPADAPIAHTASQRREGVAIIAASCRLPNAISSLQDLWQQLDARTDCISEIPAERWDVDDLFSTTPYTEGKISHKRGGFLAAARYHDPAFFDLSPAEAKAMDPQQRLIHQMAWEAVEQSLIAHQDLSDLTTGVFVGISSYDFCALAYDSDKHRPAYTVGFLPTFIAGRLSHWLNLSGPSLVVDTACSSSLVAVHLACQSILSGESDMAFAGGVSMMLVPKPSQALGLMGILAPDGACKTFDDRADGTVRSEGAGLVLLKDLDLARRDGDRILGVIRGSAVNHDARSTNVGAPNGRAQVRVMRKALAQAGVSPAEVCYVEAHGTGTALGDAIELSSLAEVYDGEARHAPLHVGSVKTNVGHTEAAAGISGLAKILASFEHGSIPPHLHFERPNKKFDWAGHRLHIPVERIALPDVGALAAVSSFGISGTNAHLVVEAPARPAVAAPQPDPTDRTHHVLCLSAKSAYSLRELARRYLAQLAEQPTIDLASLAHTANTRRSHFALRKAVVFADRAELLAQLQAIADGKHKLVAAKKPAKLAFLFTGQGGAAVGMGRELYRTSAVFKAAVDRCDRVVGELLDRPYDAIVGDVASLFDVRYTQAALSTLQYALCRLLEAWGVRPTHVAGHSGGAFMAAAESGALSVDDALTIAVKRSRMMSRLPATFAMATCATTTSALADVLAAHGGGVTFAGENAPHSQVIVGPTAEVEAVIGRLATVGIKGKVLVAASAGVGFHSRWVDAILAELAEACAGIEVRPPALRYVSSLLGRPLGVVEALDGSYWTRMTREPIRWADAIKVMLHDEVTTFVEIGPHTTLTALGPLNASERHHQHVVWKNTLSSTEPAWAGICNVLKALYEQGFDLDWRAFDAAYARARVSLPGYPFELVDVGVHPYERPSTTSTTG